MGTSRHGARSSKQGTDCPGLNSTVCLCEADHTNCNQKKVWSYIVVHHTSKPYVFLSTDINVAVLCLQLRRGADVAYVCALRNKTKPTAME